MEKGWIARERGNADEKSDRIMRSLYLRLNTGRFNVASFPGLHTAFVTCSSLGMRLGSRGVCMCGPSDRAMTSDTLC